MSVDNFCLKIATIPGLHVQPQAGRSSPAGACEQEQQEGPVPHVISQFCLSLYPTISETKGSLRHAHLIDSPVCMLRDHIQPDFLIKFNRAPCRGRGRPQPSALGSSPVGACIHVSTLRIIPPSPPPAFYVGRAEGSSPYLTAL